MKYRLLILAIVVAILTSVLTLSYSFTTEKKCLEDQACWNCETMGNQVCGRESND